MRVFVSGEDGLLPRAIIAGLRAGGATILNDQVEKTWYPPMAIMEAIGVMDVRELEVNVLAKSNVDLVARLKPDLIVHAAAMVGTDKCILDERLAWRCNVETTFNMAWAAREAGARLIYLSSSAAYDPDLSVPRPYSADLDWQYPPRPRTIYGQTKYLGELVCAQVFGLDRPLLIVRPSFIYGGVRDTSSTIIRVAKAVLFGAPPVEVLLAAKNLKDFMHVDDFAEIMLGLINEQVEGTLDVVRGHPRPFGDALDVLRGLLGADAVAAKMDWRPEGDYMGDHYATGDVAWVVSGYEPQIDLEDGLRMAVNELEESRDESIVVAG